MKILWHSNAPWASTGYGQQTALFAPRIRDLGHDVALSGFYGLEGARIEWNGMHVYPTDHTRFGNVMLPYYIGRHAAGECDPGDVLLLTLMDVHVLRTDRMKDMRIASWCPVDHDPLPPLVGQFFDRTGATPIAMSRFGERMLRDEGFDPLYVPHGIDTTVFKPPADRAAARRAMGAPEDAFVVGMVANNQGSAVNRKAFPQVFQAFAEFHRSRPDSILYLHSDVFGFNNGVHLLHLASNCGIPETAVAITDQLNLHLGCSPEEMAAIMGGFDVLACPSFGEGFGIPIVEAQACGVPVIVTDWTAMPELCGAGWKVLGDRWYDSPQGSFYMCPAVVEILDAFEAAYQARGDEQLRAKAREFALGYDVETVMRDYWTPALEAVDRPREVPPLAAARTEARVAA